MNFRTMSGMMGLLMKVPNNEIRILMYHRVNPATQLTDPHINVTPQQFDSQMEWLNKHNWKVISLDNALQQLSNSHIEQKHQVVLTFDDGYRDNFDHAFPNLKKYGFPATIYLVSDRIDNDPEFLTLHQIRIMQEHGVTFGAHTLTHPVLTSIDDSLAWNEIEGSRNDLEAKLGVPVKHFAYPKGWFNAIHEQMLQRAGFMSGMSVAPGGNTTASDKWALRRTEIALKDTMLDFKLKLRGGFDWKHKLIQIKQGLYPLPRSVHS
ncbi:MAG: polysaccharide deacetylase family protein [SAR324 cluster bacterium]|nr:polysaccharide deacetylase family protein [SAR324 cluster bacterium]